MNKRKTLSELIDNVIHNIRKILGIIIPLGAFAGMIAYLEKLGYIDLISRREPTPVAESYQTEEDVYLNKPTSTPELSTQPTPTISEKPKSTNELATETLIPDYTVAPTSIHSIYNLADQIETAIQSITLYYNKTDDSSDGWIEFMEGDRNLHIDPVILQALFESDFLLYLRELIDGEPTGLFYGLEIKDGELYVNTYDDSINGEGNDSPAWVGGRDRTYDLALGPKDDPELPELVPIDDSDVALTYKAKPTPIPGSPTRTTGPTSATGGGSGASAN